MTIAYRATVYARSSAGSETTVMTPISGSHSDAFKVSTMQGVSGFQPYMDLPKGQKGSTSLPSAKVSVGTISFAILDKRLTEGGSNFTRWASAFLGDESHRLRIMGRKVFVEESIDSGTTWTPYFVGRVTDITLDNSLQYSLSVSDAVEDMKRTIFPANYLPDVDYINPEQLHPYGMSGSLFDAPGAGTITATVAASSDFSFKFIDFTVNDTYSNGDLSHVDRDILTIATGSNQLSQRFRSSVPHAPPTPLAFYYAPQYYNTGATVHVPGGSLILNNWSEVQSKSNSNYYLSSFRCFEMNPSSSGYVPVSTFHAGQQVEFSITGGETKYYLGPISPLQVVKDILDGHMFSTRGTDGSRITIDYDATTLNALIADPTIPEALFYIEKPMSVVDFIEKHVCQPYSLAYTVDSVSVGGVPKSQVRFFKTSLPLSLPSVTLTDDTDTLATDTVAWTAGVPLSNFAYNYYVDHFNPLLNHDSSNSNDTIIVTKTPSFVNIDSDIYLPNGTLEVDALGVRSGFDLTAANVSNVGNPYALAQPLYNRWGFGAPTVTLQCRRTATVVSASVGDWMLIDLDRMPNQSLNARGGVRLSQLTQKSEQGASVKMVFVDGALNQVASAPTVGSLSIIPSSSIPVVVLPVTSSLASTLTFQALTAALGEGTPSSTDTRWTTVDYQKTTTGAATLRYIGATYGTRVYGRARNEGYSNSDLMLPSPWVQASNYVDVAQLHAPSNLSITNITTHSAKATWVTGSATLNVEVLLASPASASLQRVAMLDAGSTIYTMTGLELDASPTHSVAVRHRDLFGNISPMVSGTFIAVNPPAQLTRPSLLQIFIGT